MPASGSEDGLKLVLVHDLRCGELHVDVVWPEAVRVNAAFVSSQEDNIVSIFVHLKR